MSTNQFYIINRHGIKTLCTLKRGTLYNYDTVHIVDGLCGGDTGRTLQELESHTGNKAITVEFVKA